MLESSEVPSNDLNPQSACGEISKQRLGDGGHQIWKIWCKKLSDGQKDQLFFQKVYQIWIILSSSMQTKEINTSIPKHSLREVVLYVTEVQGCPRYFWLWLYLLLFYWIGLHNIVKVSVMLRSPAVLWNCRLWHGM